MKILKKLILGIFLLIVLIAIALFIYLNGTKPVISGKFVIPSGETTGKIVIERDKWGVPLIEAENKQDMFWAMGFVHASDRLFQMDLIRRLATGRLSEVFGRRALESDKEQKDLMIDEGIKRSMRTMSPKLKRVLESYCRGVNYYMGKFSLPPEFKLLGYSPEPWEIKDIFAVIKRMEIILAGSGSELYNMKVYSALGKERAEELLYGSHGSTIINPEEYKNFTNNPALAAAYKRELENLEKFVGSNNWVISGSKTESGKPILCNDPHLSNVFPSYFYQLKLKSGDIELSGNSIAGSPFVIIGQNSKISWGFTNVGTDVIDYFILKTDPGDEYNYYLDGVKTEYEVIEKKIKIKGEKDFIYKVKVSKFGAVMKSGETYMARHSLNEYPSTAIEAIFEMNFSQNIGEFIRSLRKWSFPAQNAVFADTEGNIGYYPTGLIPIRAKGNGALPLSGDTINNLWKGFYDEEKKPYVINPEKGFMATANNRVIPEGEIPLFAKNWYPSFRVDRISEMIETGGKLSVEDNMAFQTDTFLKSGEFILNIIRDHNSQSPGAVYVLDELKKWDLRADSGIGPLLFYRFERILSDEMFNDEFKDEESHSLISRSWIYRLLNYPDGEFDTTILNNWADDKKTDQKEEFKDMVERSLTLTYEDYLKRKEKGDQNWTNIHTLAYKHPLGSVFPLKYFINRGPYGTKGGKDCVMVSTFRNRKDFNIVHLSTFRMIIDMSDYSNSRMINSSGQSGHFMSKFYDDQINSYVSGKYRLFENPPLKKYKIEIVLE
ncbi:MAG: penicillin acylase family protein [Candidatus Aminicenantes bacterium]|nr:penicillin acylase family protein [Candidatus Aminicenantes bacterium]